jgi:hypothetical protein
MRRSMSQSGSATLAKPHIVSIDPMLFKSEGKQTFTINGSGFKKDCDVVFQLKNDPAVKVKVDPDSVTQTTIKGTTKPMKVGATLVWVQNPDGTESDKLEVKVAP